MFIFSDKQNRTREDEDRRRQRQNQGLGHMLSICGLIFLALEAFLGTMLVLPAWLELQNLRRQHEAIAFKLNKARDEEEETHDRFIWMMDPEYFEQIARDRANQAKDGEIVIRRATAAKQFPPPRAVRDGER